MSRHVEVRVLPDGRVRIHYFVFAKEGPVQLPTGAVMTAMGAKVVGGAAVHDEDGIHVSRGYIACDPKKSSVLPENKRGTIRPTVHSDEARAVTCPECQATEEWKAVMARLKETLPAGG